MSESDHRRLVTGLLGCKGRVMLSGYRSDMYDDVLLPAGWERHERPAPNHAAKGSRKRTVIECLWCNFTSQKP
jgi:DNA adenine methylase